MSVNGTRQFMLPSNTRRKRYDDDKSDRRSDTSSKTTSSMTSWSRRQRYRGGRLRKSKNCFGTIPEVEYQNTYKLKPDEADRFCTTKVEQIIYSVLESTLRDKDYDAKKCSGLGTKMADQIKERVKASGLARYKLVAYVTIVQNSGEGFQQVSRCLWDPDVDNFASAVYECKSFHVVGSLFAIYYE